MKEKSSAFVPWGAFKVRTLAVTQLNKSNLKTSHTHTHTHKHTWSSIKGSQRLMFPPKSSAVFKVSPHPRPTPHPSPTFSNSYSTATRHQTKVSLSAWASRLFNTPGGAVEGQAQGAAGPPSSPYPQQWWAIKTLHSLSEKYNFKYFTHILHLQFIHTWLLEATTSGSCCFRGH